MSSAVMSTISLGKGVLNVLRTRRFTVVCLLRSYRRLRVVFQKKSPWAPDSTFPLPYYIQCIVSWLKPFPAQPLASCSLA